MCSMWSCVAVYVFVVNVVSCDQFVQEIVNDRSETTEFSPTNRYTGTEGSTSGVDQSREQTALGSTSGVDQSREQTAFVFDPQITASDSQSAMQSARPSEPASKTSTVTGPISTQPLGGVQPLAPRVQKKAGFGSEKVLKEVESPEEQTEKRRKEEEMKAERLEAAKAKAAQEINDELVEVGGDRRGGRRGGRELLEVDELVQIGSYVGVDVGGLVGRISTWTTLWIDVDDVGVV